MSPPVSPFAVWNGPYLMRRFRGKKKRATTSQKTQPGKKARAACKGRAPTPPAHTQHPPARHIPCPCAKSRRRRVRGHAAYRTQGSQPNTTAFRRVAAYACADHHHDRERSAAEFPRARGRACVGQARGARANRARGASSKHPVLPAAPRSRC